MNRQAKKTKHDDTKIWKKGNLLEDEDIKIKPKKRNKKQKLKTPEQKSKNKKIKIIIISVIIILIISFGIWLGITTHRWKMLAQDMALNECSTVKDTSGNTIAELGSEKKKIKVNLKDMPSELKNAYVAIEDERFYKHGGVDVKRTSAAIFSYIFHAGSSSYGGSTITQQLVKNLTGDSTDSVARKIKEWWKASQLETCLSKDEILETYLNAIYVGPNIYGVGAGSKYYFDKSVDDLSLEECAFLAGINNSPNSYNPFENSNTERINKRTKIVLSKMLELKYIDKTQYDNAVSNVEKGLNFKKGEITSGNRCIFLSYR